MARKKKSDLDKQADQILKMAKEKGVQQNFFFVTTFERYRKQIQIMQELAKEIDEIGATVTKEYVKGRMNVYTNPAITEYNKTSTAANGTVKTLIDIIKSLTDESQEGSKLEDVFKELEG